MQTTLSCAFAQWSPGLGDNYLMGWVTVLAYLLAAFASGLVARRLVGADPPVRRERRFWAWVP